ncbi:MAG: phosphatidate cytidylyltransferase [Vicinamibacteraceae bacterium]
MTRVLSALVLLPAVLGIAWYLPPIYTTIMLGIIVALAFDEYARMARLGSDGYPRVIAGAATLAAYVGVWAGVPLALVFAPALLVGAAAAVGRGRPDEDAMRLAAVTLFPLLYIAVPLGMAASLHTDRGPLALMVPFLVVVASDSAQYYGGRTLGRRPLAPRISPKKTVEGAISGVLVAAVATPFVARIVTPEAPLPLLVLLGVMLAILGIMGDLFESLLKRASGLKDSSSLIPGHGGILDRIDALLFVFPAYVLFLRYARL